MSQQKRQASTETSAIPEHFLDGERLLTVQETAQALGLCLDSVRRHLRSGRLQGVRVGRSWRIPQRHLLTQLGVSVVALGLGGGERRTEFTGVNGSNRAQDTTLSLGSGESARQITPQITANQPDEDVALALLKSDPLRGHVRALLAQTANAADLSARSVERLLAELDYVLA